MKNISYLCCVHMCTQPLKIKLILFSLMGKIENKFQPIFLKTTATIITTKIYSNLRPDQKTNTQNKGKYLEIMLRFIELQKIKGKY